jgi:hypothetical protein
LVVNVSAIWRQTVPVLTHSVQATSHLAPRKREEDQSQIQGQDPFEWFATGEKKDYVVFGRVKEEPNTYEYGAGIDEGADCPTRTGPKIIVEG